MSACRSCGAPIEWAILAKSGKRIPLDSVPVVGGNIMLTEAGNAVVVSPGPDPLYKSHFVTCPHADEHRKRR